MPGFRRQSGRWAGWFMPLGLLLLLSSPGFGEGDDEEERIEAAIQNPALRDYFRERITDMNTVTDLAGRQRTSFSYPLEDQIDRMARVYLKKVLSTLEEVQSGQEVVRGLRQETRLSTASAARKELLAEWRSSLRDLADAVASLRSEVRPVLIMAHRKGPKKSISLPTRVTTPDGLDREIDDIDSELAQVLSATESFFFEASHTVTVTALSEGDLLAILERVEERISHLAGVI